MSVEGITAEVELRLTRLASDLGPRLTDRAFEIADQREVTIADAEAAFIEMAASWQMREALETLIQEAEHGINWRKNPSLSYALDKARAALAAAEEPARTD